MLPSQGEMGENIPFTRKCTSEPSETLKRVTTERSKITVGSESNISELFGWPNVIPHFSIQFNYLFSLILSKTHGSHFK